MSDGNINNEEYLAQLNRRYNELLDRQAELDLMELTKINPTDNHVIRVGFLCQEPGLWDNIVSVYEIMEKREDFAPFIIVIPPLDFKTMNLYLDYDTNFFIKKYPDAIRAYNDNLELLDLRGLDLDYLFFPRPYDAYIPEEYRSMNTIKYVKNCYVPYAYVGTESALSLYEDPLFFRNMYLLFMESESTRELMEELRGSAVKKGLQKVLSIGYPALEAFLGKTCRDEINTIIWTPRWSYDEKLGGSHFLEYKDMLFELKEKYPDKEIIFRPHPLLYDEMEKKGFMSKDEIDEYVRKLKEYEIVIDTGTSFEETFDRGDLLISDMSSIMMHWMLTGKPLIFCPSPIKLYGFFKEIESNSYLAESKEDILTSTESIVDGNDPKKTARSMLVERSRKEHLGAAERIVEVVSMDYYKNY